MQSNGGKSAAGNAAEGGYKPAAKNLNSADLSAKRGEKENKK